MDLDYEHRLTEVEYTELTGLLTGSPCTTPSVIWWDCMWRLRSS